MARDMEPGRVHYALNSHTTTPPAPLTCANAEGTSVWAESRSSPLIHGLVTSQGRARSAGCGPLSSLVDSLLLSRRPREALCTRYW
jgi:hypothetical protein